MKKSLFLLTLVAIAANARTGGAVLLPIKWNEQEHVKFHCLGEIEYRLPDNTRVDCLTETHAIEYDWGKKWAEAIGQSLFYSAMTGKRAGIVLIVNPRTKDRYLRRLQTTIRTKNLDIDVWTMEQKHK